MHSSAIFDKKQSIFNRYTTSPLCMGIFFTKNFRKYCSKILLYLDCFSNFQFVFNQERSFKVSLPLNVQSLELCELLGNLFEIRYIYMPVWPFCECMYCLKIYLSFCRCFQQLAYISCSLHISQKLEMTCFLSSHAKYCSFMFSIGLENKFLHFGFQAKEN